MMVYEYTTEDFVEAIVEHAREEGSEEKAEQIARKMKTSGEPLTTMLIT